MEDNELDRVYEKIKQKILVGEYVPSQRLVEANLTRDLGVSRHKVRSALERLHLEDLVRIEPNRGATVKSLELAETLDMLTARETLEAGVAYLAAGKITAVQLQQLAECLATMREGLEQGDFDRYSATNKIFHQIICEASGNETMPQLIHVLRQRLARLHLRTILIPGRTEKSIQEHDAIFLALQAQDATAAEQAARSHIQSLRDAIEKAWQLLA